ncbi:unnamed protein product [Pleuronectes platessa]|uniref:Uncharacterized protein n=1 Tax=Pleuronectes platessa TaxID=8262 RepID=A0A9N7V1U4_PLEPL|nr:unnamed protein product [Pleuronectes platessa]
MEDGINGTCRLHSPAGGQSLLPGSRLHERLPLHVGPQRDDDLSGAACCVSLHSGSSGTAWFCRVPSPPCDCHVMTCALRSVKPRKRQDEKPSIWCVRVLSTSP